VKIGLVAGWVDGALAAPSYVAAREGAAAFGDRLLGEAARRGALEIVGWEGGRTGAGLAVLRDVLILGDGARWIWTLAAEHFGARREVVDFYHASEHLWTVARLLESEGTAVAAAWGAARCHELRHDGVDPVRTALGAARATTADGRKPCAASAPTSARTPRGWTTPPPRPPACRSARGPSSPWPATSCSCG
jgi:hypothetical protein